MSVWEPSMYMFNATRWASSLLWTGKRCQEFLRLTKWTGVSRMVNMESQSLFVLKTSEGVPGKREWDAMGCCGRLRQQAEHWRWNWEEWRSLVRFWSSRSRHSDRWCVHNRRGAEGTDKDQALTFSSLTVQWYKQRNVQWVALGVATVPHCLGDCPIVLGILPFPTRKKKKKNSFMFTVELNWRDRRCPYALCPTSPQPPYYQYPPHSATRTHTHKIGMLVTLDIQKKIPVTQSM